jgi:ElaB/YqjD/DUF883 family membrane-anchored ribosome-binding protein
MNNEHKTSTEEQIETEVTESLEKLEDALRAKARVTEDTSELEELSKQFSWVEQAKFNFNKYRNLTALRAQEYITDLRIMTIAGGTVLILIALYQLTHGAEVYSYHHLFN